MGYSPPVSGEEFRQLIEPLLERAGAYACSIVRNREDAEDALQDAALKAYQSLEHFDRSRSFKGWWFAIIRNCCLDLLRKRQRSAAAIKSTEPPEGRSDERDAMEQSDRVRWALSQLSPAHREIIELRYLGDCSYRDIAEALGIPEGTVMSRLHAARQALGCIYGKGEK